MKTVKVKLDDRKIKETLEKMFLSIEPTTPGTGLSCQICVGTINKYQVTLKITRDKDDFIPNLGRNKCFDAAVIDVDAARAERQRLKAAERRKKKAKIVAIEGKGATSDKGTLKSEKGNSPALTFQAPSFDGGQDAPTTAAVTTN